MADTDDHKSFAEALRAAVIGSGVTPAEFRAGAMSRASGGPAIVEPFDALVTQIGQAAYRVTDSQLSAARESLGSDKAAFEVVMAASIGAGLMRWDQGLRALAEAEDAAR